ncbi:MAG TPA: LuxR C-terminal-related transcriptional regulator [Ignavibacteriaceae bacterium]|nr:LuxR C-terminal-related transcriptional regulator [Ignavibacteriaceae bacterium]
MNEFLISTKLYKPALQPKTISRTRLLEKLNSGLKNKLILVSAPAGFGKTTILTDWISQAEFPSAWVSLDSGDNDPKRFFTYCLAALQNLNGNIQDGIRNFGENTQALFNSTQQVPVETIVASFINDISTSSAECILVLDDFHLVNSPNLHQTVASFIDHIPLNLHLVIASRHDPSFALSKMRVRKELCEVREADLRFTPEETEKFFRETMDLHLGYDEINNLENRTEGWIASLQLAALAMQGRKNIPEFIQKFSGSHNYIVDYLTEEVLQHLDNNIQEFLLFTSILERFNSQLCDYLTNGSESQHILEFLDRSKLFLVPLDENKKWFRYHHLFSDLLKFRLEQLFPDIIRTLHRRASEWFEKNSYTEDAFNHALAAGDKERAADLIDAASIPVLVKGELTTLQNWSEKIPADLLSERAYLLLSLAWIHNIRGDLQKAAPFVEQIEKIISREDSKYNEKTRLDLLGHVALIKSYSYNPVYSNDYGTISIQRELILEAKKYLEADNPTYLQSTINLVLGWTYLYSGELDDAFRTFEKAYKEGEASNNHIVTLSGAYNQTVVLLLQGKLKLGYNFALKVIKEYSGRHGKFFLPLGFTYLGIGEIFYHMNRFKEAEEYLNYGLRISELMGNWTMFFHAVYLLALIKQIQGDYKSVKNLLKKEQEALSKSPSFFREIAFEANKVRLWLIQKNKKAAANWMDKYNSDPMRECPFFFLGDIISARILMENEEYFEALNLIENKRDEFEKMGVCLWILESRILKALIFEKEGETGKALTELKEAVKIAAPEGFKRIFINEGKIMSDLLADILTDSQDDKSLDFNFISSLIEEINAEEGESSQGLDEPLSDREIEVLRLLASGFSNQDIADKLYVAVGTVKKHTHQIYQKLNVTGRTKAIQLARELELI